MRRILAAIVVLSTLLWAIPAQADWSVTATRTACGGGFCDVTDTFVDNNIDVTGLSIVSGDFIAVGIHYSHSTVTVSGVVCDSNTLASAQTTDGANGFAAIWFVRATSSADNCVATTTGNTGGTVDLVGVVIASGSVDPAAETGTSAGAQNDGTTSTEQTVTPGVSNVLFVAIAGTVGGASGPVCDADFTDVECTDSGGNIYFEYRVQNGSSAAAAWQVAADATETFTTAVAAFEGAASAAGGAPALTLLGVGPGQ